MAERSPLLSTHVTNLQSDRSTQPSVRALWKNWLPDDAVLMARKSTSHVAAKADAPVVSTPLVVVTDPWNTQDAQAKPLLDRMILAMGLSPEKVIVLEVSDADLLKRVQELNPQTVVALGAAAAQALLGTDFSFETHRSQWQSSFGNLKTMPTLDLQTLLKNPAAKKEAWADLQKVMKALAG